MSTVPPHGALMSYEQAPAISVPFRFFLTAPWFGIMAGLVLAFAGPSALESRWAPATLSLVHLLTTGFMLQAMCGALLQMVPVAAGGNVWRPQLLAGFVHPLLTAAAAALSLAFLYWNPTLFLVATFLFVAGLTPFIVVVLAALLRSRAHGPSILAFRLALPALAVTLVVGGLMASGFGLGKPVSLPGVVDIHALWGLGAWSAALLAGASYFLVPMFQLTPQYPRAVAMSIPLLFFSSSIVASAMLVTGNDAFSLAGSLIAAAAAIVLAIVSLTLQQRRRRKRVDQTFHLFRTAMISLLLAACLFAASRVFPLAADPRIAICLGALVLVGTFVSAINGALYKIVPFLCWLHLQRLGPVRRQIPNMSLMLPPRLLRIQLAVYWVSLGLLAGAIFFAPLARPAGLALTASFAIVEWNLIAAALSYRKTKLQWAAEAAPPGRRAEG